LGSASMLISQKFKRPLHFSSTLTFLAPKKGKQKKRGRKKIKKGGGVLILAPLRRVFTDASNDKAIRGGKEGGQKFGSGGRKLLVAQPKRKRGNWALAAISDVCVAESSLARPSKAFWKKRKRGRGGIRGNGSSNSGLALPREGGEEVGGFSTPAA